MEKTTALYQTHLNSGGKMVSFGGYLMPVQYPTGVIAEHMAVRTKAGMFDVSHMAEIRLTGANVLQFIQYLLTNDMDGMKNGDCRYSPMCNEKGGVVDDLIVYKLSEEEYWFISNASNHDKDLAWIYNAASQTTGVIIEDLTDSTGEIALQGPLANAILSGLVTSGDLPVQYYTFTSGVVVAGIECMVSRTGYTGEDGYEIYCEAAKTPALWQALLNAGASEGLIPCGLGARDTLRLEAGMPLYGHEMSDTISPKEACLGMFIKLAKPAFIGRQALEKLEPARRRTGLRVTGRGIAREGCTVHIGEACIGVVTSGTQLPYLGYAGAMAMLDVEHREIGTRVEVDIRGRRVEAEVIKLPFYKRNK